MLMLYIKLVQGDRRDGRILSLQVAGLVINFSKYISKGTYYGNKNTITQRCGSYWNNHIK